MYLKESNDHERQRVTAESSGVGVCQFVGVNDLLEDDHEGLQKGLCGLELFDELCAPQPGVLPELEGDVDLVVVEVLGHHQLDDWHAGSLDELYFLDLLLPLHKPTLTNIWKLSNMVMRSAGF
jgi:hypothetical protein